MFKIVRNTFISDGICRYEDEHGNKIFVRRWLGWKGDKEDGFTAKLRFKDIPVTVSSFETAVPIKYEDMPNGFPIRLDFPAGYDISTKEIQSVLQEFSDMIVHWDSMLAAIRMMNCDNRLLMMAYPDAKSEEEIQTAKINNLYQYPELQDTIVNVMEKY